MKNHTSIEDLSSLDQLNNNNTRDKGVLSELASFASRIKGILILVGGLSFSTLAISENADAACRLKSSDCAEGQRLSKWRQGDDCEEMCRCVPDSKYLQNKLAGVIAENVALRERDRQLTDENERLGRDLTTSQRNASALGNRLESSERSVSDLRNQVGESNVNIGRLNGQLATANRSLEELNRDISRVTEENTNLRRHVATLEAKNADLKARNLRLSRQSGTKIFADTSVGLRVENNEPADSCREGCTPIEYKKATFPSTTDVGVRYEWSLAENQVGLAVGGFGRLNVGSDGEFSGGGGLEGRLTWLPEKRRILAVVFDTRVAVEGYANAIEVNPEASLGIGVRTGPAEITVFGGYRMYAPKSQENIPFVGIGASLRLP